MLNSEQCRAMAQEKCISMFGKNFVNQHKSEFCSTMYTDLDQGVFEYSLLWAPLEEPSAYEKPVLSMGNRPFDYYASVIVDMNKETVNVDSDKTKLPNFKIQL